MELSMRTGLQIPSCKEKGMEEMSEKFKELGSEVYVKAE